MQAETCFCSILSLQSCGAAAFDFSAGLGASIILGRTGAMFDLDVRGGFNAGQHRQDVI